MCSSEDYSWGLGVEGLFDMVANPLAVDELVTVQTIYGDEQATVVALTRSDDGYRYVQVRTSKGDLLTVSVSRVRR